MLLFLTLWLGSGQVHRAHLECCCLWYPSPVVFLGKCSPPSIHTNLYRRRPWLPRACKGQAGESLGFNASGSLGSLVSCSLDSSCSVPHPLPCPTSTLCFGLSKLLIHHFQCPATVVMSVYPIDGLPSKPQWPPGVDLRIKFFLLLVF